MSEPATPEATPSRGRGRGRGKSRGGLGKYLRARGRGRGGGRPAVFNQRLVLEGEEPADLDPDSEEAKELRAKFSRRQLGSNADRYVEPEPELNSDGEVEVEPEVDLSAFLERQRLSEESSSTAPPPGEDDVDHSLDHITSRGGAPAAQNKKGKVQQMEWDESLEALSREKAAAEATRDLKSRFRAKSEKIKSRPILPGQGSGRKQGTAYVQAPALPADEKKDEKAEMQDFLDDLLG